MDPETLAKTIALLTKLKVDLTTLRADFAAGTWFAVAADVVQSAADANQLIAMILPFLIAWYSQPRAKTFSAHGPFTLEDAPDLIDGHIADAQAGKLDLSNLLAMLVQLVPLILSLFAKPAPVAP